MLQKNTVHREKIKKDFLGNKSYAETGRINGISRQRVEQIIKSEGVTTKPALFHNHWEGKNCTVCNTPLVVQKAYHGGSETRLLCVTCRAYERKHTTSRSKILRRLLYPKRCSSCQITLETGKKRNGMCNNCYGRFIWNTNPQRRLWVRNYIHNKWLNDPAWKRKKQELDKKNRYAWIKRNKQATT